MSPLLRSQVRRPGWWFGLFDIRFSAGLLLLAFLILIDANPHAFAQPQPNSSTSTSSPELPPWREINNALTDFFKRKQNYRSGDLITQEEGQAFLKLLPKFGWTIDQAEQNKLLDKLLPEKHFLVQELHTPAGTKFMRKIEQYPLGYDRVHRLIGIPNGQNRLKELIRGPDGYKLIEYMADAKGGKNLGTMLGNVAGGKNFNQPTGNIYTETAFRDRLHDLHLKAAAELKEKSTEKP